jgi:hypothetical protein
MSRTPTRFNLADVVRNIRAARQAGADGVDARPDQRAPVLSRTSTQEFPQSPIGETSPRDYTGHEFSRLRWDSRDLKPRNRF